MTLSRTFSSSAPHEPGEPRTPLLILDVWGPAARGYVPVSGVVDSGSEVSVIAGVHARHLRLTPDHSEPLTIRCANGVEAVGYRTQKPIAARLNGDSRAGAFSLHPYVVDGATTNLWGMKDFFRAFHVEFRFSEREFRLTLADS